MKSGKLITILLLLFALSFAWAGGTSFFRRLLPTMPSTQSISKEMSSSWERTYRIIALKSAIDAKLDKKKYTKIQYIPLTMQQAIIAVEDNRFYRHVGFDIEGIIRATLVNMQTGEFTEGGSTITYGQPWSTCKLANLLKGAVPLPSNLLRIYFSPKIKAMNVKLRKSY